MDFFSLFATLFLIMDPFGNLPVIISLLKDYDRKTKTKIILRELVISLFLIFLFIFFGKNLMHLLGLKEASISIAGGVILFLIAIKMIFPSSEPLFSAENELFIVPIAIPMIAGPSLLATLLLFSTTYDIKIVLLAALLAWFVSSLIILIFLQLSSYIPYKFFSAAEKLMGMLLIALSVQMLLDGISKYLKIK
jgi:multiple antibiotic resistance protein